MHPRRAARFVLLAALPAVLVAGCGTATVTGSASPEGSSIASAEAAARDKVSSGGGGTPVDACALVPAADVEALIGANDGGMAAPPVGDGGSCVWQNDDNYYSVTVDIGATGTATNGLPDLDPALGEAEALPDGMRWFAGGVEFEANGRDCQAQVATNDTADGGDKAASVALARAVKGKVP